MGGVEVSWVSGGLVRFGRTRNVVFLRVRERCAGRQQQKSNSQKGAGTHAGNYIAEAVR